MPEPQNDISERLTDEGWQPRQPQRAPSYSETPPDTPPEPRVRSRWPWFLVGLLLALLLGMLASPWVEGRVRGWLPFAAPPVATAPDPRVAALESRIARLEGAETRQSASDQASALVDMGPIAARIAALEAQDGTLLTTGAGLNTRVDQLSQEMQRLGGAADAGTAQLRELFLLSVGRRLLSAGRSLSPLMPALERHYAGQYPAAVEALGAWSGNPHNRATLVARLQALPAESPAGNAVDGNWWDRIRARLSGLVSVRGAGQEKRQDDAAQLAAAQQALGSGDLAVATAQVEKLPAGSVRDAWLADARLLLAAEQALDMLEESAVSRSTDAAAATLLPGTPPPVNAPPPIGTLPPR